MQGVKTLVGILAGLLVLSLASGLSFQAFKYNHSVYLRVTNDQQENVSLDYKFVVSFKSPCYKGICLMYVPAPYVEEGTLELGPGESETFNYTGGFQVSTIGFLEKVGPNYTVLYSESYENISQATVDIGILDAGYDRETGHVYASVKNLGDLEESFNMTLAAQGMGLIVIDPETGIKKVIQMPIIKERVPVTLAPGEEKRVEFQTQVSPGTYTIYADIQDDNETNNNAMIVVPVFKPDLVVTASIVRNELVVNVSNIGNDTAKDFRGYTRIAYQDGNVIEANFTIDALEPNESKYESVQLVTGTVTKIYAKVDPDNNVSELDETNNEYQASGNWFIDATPPEVTILAYPTRSRVGDDIVVKGEFSDNSELALVGIEYRYSDSSNIIKSNITENTSHVVESFTIPGEYASRPGKIQFDILAYDQSGNYNSATGEIEVYRPSSGGGGGAGGGGIIPNPNPPTPKPKPVNTPGIVTITKGNISETIDYYYDPEKNETTLTLVFKGLDGANTYRIQVSIPKAIAKSTSDISISPSPDEIVRADPIIAWTVGLAKGQTFTVKITIPGKVDTDLVKDMPAPEISVIAPRPSPKPSPTPKPKPPTPNPTPTPTPAPTPKPRPVTGLITLANGLSTLAWILALAGILALAVIALERKGYKIRVRKAGQETQGTNEKPVTAEVPGDYESGKLYTSA